jgi:hypothetical protein
LSTQKDACYAETVATANVKSTQKRDGNQKKLQPLKKRRRKKMGRLHYKGKTINTPDYINGKEIKKVFGIPHNRTVYATLDGQNQLIGDNDTMYIRNTKIEDIPYTERG